jgi:WD40 repeat protein
VAFSPTGRFLATANDSDPFIRVWDLARNKVGLLPGVPNGGSLLGFAPDRPILAVAGLADNVVQLWDIDAIERRGAEYLPPQAQRVFALGFAPGGNVLATTSTDRSIDLWNLAGPKPRSLRRLVGHREPVTAFGFAPDGRQLASVAADQTLRMWNVETGKQEQQVPGLHVRSLAFSPDGKTLAFGGGETGKSGDMRMLDIVEGRLEEQRVTLQRGHTRPVTSLAFVPDGEGLVSAGEDGQVILHGPRSGQPLHAWRFPGAVRNVAVAVDGRHLATANANGTVYVLRLRTFSGKS